MRIFYLINSLGAGGAEHSLVELLPRLRAAGLETVVASLQGAQVPEGGTMPRRSEVAVPCPGSNWIGKVRSVRRLLRTHRPSLLHTTLFDADIIGRLAGRLEGVPVLTSLVNTSYDRARMNDPAIDAWKLAATRSVDGFTARNLTHHFHAITQAVKDSSVATLRLDPDMVTVVERGRDPMRLGEPGARRRSRSRARLAIPDEAEVIVNVGRQEWQKAHVVLVRAFDALAARRPAAHLVIAGRSGHASAELGNLVEASPYRQRIHILGHREDIPEILAAGDVFAFPSHYEGLGGAVIEAMALGLPVVASNIPALAEVVDESANARLVAPGDGPGLATALEGLLADPALRSAFGRQSRRIFEERFTLERSVDGMVALYQLVADRSRHRLSTTRRGQ